MSFTLLISFQVNKRPLLKKKLLLSSRIFLACSLTFLNQKLAPNTFFFIIYFMCFDLQGSMPSLWLFFYSKCVWNTCHWFSLIFLAFCYQFQSNLFLLIAMYYSLIISIYWEILTFTSVSNQGLFSPPELPLFLEDEAFWS